MTAARRLLAAVVGAAWLVLGVGPALAATPPAALVVESADPAGYPQVDLVVSAPASLAGEDLAGGSFTVTEAGRPRPVTATRLAGAEQEIVLVIDVSGSMRGASMEGAKAAAAEFVARAPEGARIAVIAFGIDVTVVTEFTTDTAVQLAGIASLTAGGDTALFDGVTRAVELLAAGQAAAQTVVLLSDGDDTASTGTIGAAGNRVAGSAATFIGVQLLTPGTDPADLAALVSTAGGTLITAGDAAGLAAIYRKLAVESGNRYLLTYDSSALGRTDVHVSVTADGVPLAAATYRVELPELAPLGAGPSPAVPAGGQPAADLAAGGGLLSAPLGLGLGLLAGALGIALVLFVVLPPPARRLAASRLDPLVGDPSSRLSGPTDRVSSIIAQVVSRGVWTPIKPIALEQAGISMRLPDVLLLITSGALALFAVCLLLGGPALGIVAGVLVPFGARTYVSLLAGRRKAKFADQLDDTLQLIASSLRAGHSLLRSVDAVAREAEAPTATEFARIINETRLGRDLGPALDDTATRMGSEDFLWVAQAVAIHREVGGNLAEVLDQVGDTIRERNQIRRQVKALSAEGKLSAIVLMSLPVGVVGFLSLTNPAYMRKFTESLLGYGMILAAGTLMLVGALWLRKVVSFKF